MPLNITKENHQNEVIHSTLPVLLDVYAVWCGPCQLMNPILDELEVEYAGKLKIGKLNVDDSRELAIHYGVSSIPTFIFIKQGQVIAKEMGAKNKANLENKIKEYLNP